MAGVSAFTYTFAKEKGLIVLPSEDGVLLGVRQDAEADDLIEARRALGTTFSLKPLSPAEFERELSGAYSSGTAQRRRS